MKSTKTITLTIFFLISIAMLGQKSLTDANVIGHVVDAQGNHIPFATVTVKNSTIGTMTDDTGHYELLNLPLGEHMLLASYNGYKPVEVQVTLEKDKTIEVKFELVEDVLGLDEVVVTGAKNETTRKESTVIVSTVPARLFTLTNSANLSEGLNFCSGLRTENNCQNCGFNQVRMTGMEGPYSQILVNSRPIFSGLAGVYGLELIPQNMIDKIEVVKGGGSALYGSNAIAGTINIILKKPYSNTYQVGYNSGFNGIGMDGTDIATDQTVNFNTSYVSNDRKLGVALYGYYRDRQPFDANGDDFSEMSKIKNLTVGNHVDYTFDETNALSTDIFVIKEDRRGGNKFNQPNHVADISEALRHTLLNGSVKYTKTLESGDLDVYLSGQKVDRDSYYGAEQSLADYGLTKDFTHNAGLQYCMDFENAHWTSGYENTRSALKDRKLSYLELDEKKNELVVVPETMVSNQEVMTHGIFTQYEQKINKFKFSLGARFEHYDVKDNLSDNDKDGNVIIPRVTLKYDITEALQTRVSYGQGYRTPQIFDEDLHIETSGARKVIHKNDPDLKQETSHSVLGSFDFNKTMNNGFLGVTLEGFYTRLEDAFTSTKGDPDANGVVIYTRENAEKGAQVYGVNLESNIIPSNKLSFKLGFTAQKSEYEESQEGYENESDDKGKRFFRTPDTYGFLTTQYSATPKFKISCTANYTGSMLVPYEGEITEKQGLVESDSFVDVGLKLSYDFPLEKSATLRIYTGMKNIFNSYQDDFDVSVNRDPAYIYGPSNPRMVYLGLKLGNSLF